MNLNEAERKSGISRVTLTQWRDGKNTPRLISLEKLKEKDVDTTIFAERAFVEYSKFISKDVLKDLVKKMI